MSHHVKIKLRGDLFMKWLLAVLFTVRVIVPMAKDVEYKHVKSWEAIGIGRGYYELVLANGKKAWVPMMSTVIEEE